MSVRYIFAHEKWTIAFVFLVSVSVVGVNFYIKKTGKTNISSLIYYFAVFFVFPIRAYNLGGISSTSFYFVGVLVFVLVITESKKAANFFISSCILYLFLFYFLRLEQVQISQETQMISLAISFLMFALLVQAQQYLRYKYVKDFTKLLDKEVSDKMTLELSHEINNPLAIAMAIGNRIKVTEDHKDRKEKLNINLNRIHDVIKKIQSDADWS